MKKNDRNGGKISPEYELWVGDRGLNKTFLGQTFSHMS